MSTINPFSSLLNPTGSTSTTTPIPSPLQPSPIPGANSNELTYALDQSMASTSPTSTSDSGQILVDSATDTQSAPLTAEQLAAQAAAAAKAAEQEQARRDLTLQQSYLSGAQTQRDTAQSSIMDQLQRILGIYSADSARNEADFNTQSQTNVGNFNRNLQEAMINAARGRQGLFGTLSSLGALSGSGIRLADNAVQQGANLDIAGANEQFGENRNILTSAIEDFRLQNQRREDEANNQADILKQQANNNFLAKQQEIFVKMANLYNILGDTAQADSYAQQAAGLSNQIGQTSVAPVGSLTAANATYSPQALGNYMSQGAADVSVQQGDPSGGNLIPSLMAMVRRREQGA